MLMLVLGILFIVMGLAVHVLKMHFLISGYNTMSKEKKKKIDVEGLARFIGIYSYTNGFVFIVTGILQLLGYELKIIVAFTFLILSTIYLLVRSQRYDGNIYDANGKMREGAWKQLIIPVVIMALTIVFVIVVLFVSTKPLEVTLKDEGLEIQGVYGDVYSWDSIESVEIIDELPPIKMRTNGSKVGSKLKGHFTTKELGAVKLFVDTEVPVFIYLESNKENIIFNMEDEEKTREIFKHILEEK